MQREAKDGQDRLQALKKATPRDNEAIAETKARYKELKRSARDAAGKAQAIEYAVYDLKAVHPNRQPVVDTRTPEDLLKIIDAKGREIQDALAALRSA